MPARFDHTAADIALYDTNVWVHGLVGRHPECTDVVDAAADGQHVVVPAYVFEEVANTFQASDAVEPAAEAYLTQFV